MEGIFEIFMEFKNKSFVETTNESILFKIEKNFYTQVK